MIWFNDWIEMYCRSTGAPPNVKDMLLTNESIIVEHWGSTPEELNEITTRLIASGRVPTFANEHISTLGRELMALRGEREKTNQPTPGDFDDSCSACGGTGLAIVPVRACIWNGKLIVHRALKRVVFGAVICDRPMCNAGQRTRDHEQRRNKNGKAGLARLSQCERDMGGIDLPSMTRDYERDKAQRARISDGSSATQRWKEFKKMYPRVAMHMEKAQKEQS